MNLVNVNDYLANIAQVCRGCPTTTLRHAYMRAYREFLQQSQWLRTNVPGATTPLEPQYDLGNDPNLDIIGIYAMQGSMIIPPAVTPQTWALPAAQDPGGWNSNYQPQQPLQYTYVPEAQFALFPTPDKIYQLLITVILAPKEAAVNVPAAPLVKYSNDIEAGALEYLMGIPGQTWSNPTMAAMKGREFRSGISNGKAEVQRKYNTGPMRARPRAFAIGGGGGGGGYYP